MKYLGLIFLLGCSHLIPKPAPVVVRKKPVANVWANKKRKCHSYYLGNFGFNMRDAVQICKEELESRGCKIEKLQDNK